MMLHKKQLAAALITVSAAASITPAYAQCQMDRFVLDQPNYETYFGLCISISSDLALISAEGYDDSEPGKGAGFLFALTPNGFQLQNVFRRELEDGWFARAVAIDGDRLVITSRRIARVLYTITLAMIGS